MAISCSGSEPGGAPPPSPAAPPAALAPRAALPAGVSAPFDVTSIIKQVHLAFRPSGPDAWNGGHATYEVHASPAGFLVRPAEGTKGGAVGAPALFETVSIGRGERRVAPRGVGRVEHDGHLALARGQVTEHLRNGEDGGEQSFAFAEKPEGEGELTVRVRVTGLEYAGQTAGGHHFADPASGLGVRYGAATWVDAHGDRSPVEVIWEGEELSLRVPAAVVETASYPAVLDPVVSPEFAIDQLVTYTAAQAAQSAPAVASDGSKFFVAWNDARLGGYGIMAARVDASGTLLDPGGIPIPNGYNPAVAFDGTNYCIAWYAKANTNWEVRTTRVATTGAVLDPGGTLVVSSVQQPGGTPDIAFDGTNYLVVWDLYNSSNSSQDVYGAIVSPAGAIVKSAFPIVTASLTQARPRVSFGGGNYLVVWQDERLGGTIYGARVTPAGAVLDPTGFVVSPANTGAQKIDPDVAFDGTNFLVVWSDSRWGTYDIYGVLVAPSGVVNPVPISIFQAAGDQREPVVGFDGSTYVVAWDDTMARVSTSGTVLDPSGVKVSAAAGAKFEPAIACKTSMCFVVWTDGRSSLAYGIYGTRVTDGAVVDPGGIRVGSVPNYEEKPAIAFDGTNYLVVWQDYRSGTSWDIYGARVGKTGTLLDPSGIAISTAGNDQTSPRLAWMAPSYLVAWNDSRSGGKEIYAARVSGAGQVLDSSGVKIAATASSAAPAVGAGNTNYLVASVGSSTESFVTRATRVSAAGVVLDPLGIKLTTSSAVSTHIAFDGTIFLVVSEVTGSAIGNRVTSAGVALDGSSGFAIQSGLNLKAPDVAFDGVNYRVVYQNNGKLMTKRVTPAAVVQVGETLVSVYGTQPAVACDGKNCLVAWTDSRGGTYGSFLDAAGTVLQTAGFPISGGFSPAIATDGSGSWLVAFEASSLGVERVRAAFVNGLVTGSPCTQASQCVTNFCVDGVCCDTACTGVCMACSAAAKGSGADGICGGVAAGNDPHDDCAAQASSTCGTTGACAGAGVCALYPPGTACNACSSGSVLLKQCDGAGTCNTVGPGSSCAPYKCANGACKTSCSGQSDCATNNWCSNGTCLPKGALGAPCNGSSFECLSGYCVDGVCCESTCLGNCYACTAAMKGSGTDGTCGVVAAGTNPRNACVTELPSTCGTTGVCSGGISCAKYGASTTCGTVCVGDGVNVRHCLGNGTCGDSPPTSCAPYGCSNGACNTSCTTSADCAAGAVCTGGQCVGLLALGQPCATGAACLSGFCADGVCCNSACNAGACDACSVAAGATADGTCALLTGTACDDGNPCTQTDSCQAGVCVGGNPKVCAAMDQCHDAGTCDPTTGTCSNPAKVDGSACNDGNPCTQTDTCQAGTCVGGNPKICVAQDECHTAGACDPTSGACSVLAKPDGSPCSAGTCQAGTCVAVPDGGAGGATSSSGGAGGGMTSSTSSSGAGGGTTSSTSSSGAGGGTTSSTSSSGAGGGMTSSSSSGATACVPGQQVACPCPDAKPGVQVCLPDGSGFDPCSCVDGAAAGQGGCGCAVPGESQEGQSAPVAVLALALSIWARRRRERRRGAGGPVDARRAFVEPRGSAHRPSTREERC